MSRVGWTVFLMFLLYQNILVAQFDLPNLYRYWDEALFLILFGLAIVKLIKVDKWKINLRTFKSVVPWLLLIIVGLIGNALYGYAHGIQPIIRDIVGCMKFPLTFYVCRALDIDRKIAFAFKTYGEKWIKIISCIVLLFGFLSLFVNLGMSQSEFRGGIHPYMFLFNHPTALVFTSVAAICLLTASEKRNENMPYLLVLSIIVVLSMRTKGIAFIAVFIFMKYGGRWLRKYKILYWLGIAIAVVAASISKLQMYASWSSSGREVLYIGSMQLLVKCFPFGSGFGTYASHVSAQYLSGVYNFIDSYDFWNADGTASAVLGDTGYPYYVGQFGIVGVLLIAYGCYRLITKRIVVHKKFCFAAVSLLLYIAIALTSEAILITYGVELAILLNVLVRLVTIDQHKMSKANHAKSGIGGYKE